MIALSSGNYNSDDEAVKDPGVVFDGKLSFRKHNGKHSEGDWGGSTVMIRGGLFGRGKHISR